MHAYLITGNNQNLIQEQIEKLVKDLKVRKLGFELKKIADVRELAKFTNLSLNEKSAIVLENFDQVTADAQNAFLKNLEEPQENLIYILTARSQDSVLPTIASRCQIIELTNTADQLDSETTKKIAGFIGKSVGEKLVITSKITKREDALQFIKEIEIYLSNEFKKNPSLIYSVEVADQTLRNLEQNGNVQIQLTNFVVNSD